MTVNHVDVDPALARQVKIDNLEPYQHTTTNAFKTATDFRQQVMIKHPHLSDFHSRAEWLHAGLLEGNPAVTAYVPQPFALRIGQRRYTPDCYIVSDLAPRRVLELKPRGEFDDYLTQVLTHFFAQYGMHFEVISNESIFAREVEAENWLEIVRMLHLARDLQTQDEEYTLLDQFTDAGSRVVGDLVDAGDREHTYRQEIALWRLVQRGRLCATLTERPLDFDTVVRACA